VGEQVLVGGTHVHSRKLMVSWLVWLGCQWLDRRLMVPSGHLMKRFGGAMISMMILVGGRADSLVAVVLMLRRMYKEQERTSEEV
jgi:hypothetical protein